MKPQKSSKATKLVSTQIQNKIYKHQTQIFEEIADQISPLLKKIKNKKKKLIRLGHAGIVYFRLIYRYLIIF